MFLPELYPHTVCTPQAYQPVFMQTGAAVGDMHFHILGLGPVGSLLAHHLRNALPRSSTVTLIHKTTRQARDAREAGGIIRVENGGVSMLASGFQSEVFESSYGEIAKSIAAAQKPERPWWDKPKVILVEEAEAPQGRTDTIDSDVIETLFVTTKAHSTKPAIQRLLPRLSQHSTIVLLQNGLGVYERLVQDIFRNPEQRPHFILASNTHGAWLKGFYNVVHTGVGTIEFGIVPDPRKRDFESGFLDETVPRHDRKLRIEDISHPHDPEAPRYRSLLNTVAALSSLEALNASWKPMAQVQVAMRRKLAVNAVVNPLTALMGCRNGDIFKTEASLRIMRRVCQEAATVYAAQIKAETEAWLAVSGDKSDDGKCELGRVPPALSSKSLEAECIRVASLTRGNISSMLADIRRGRTTEIDFINGYLLNLGVTYGIPMPATATLLNLMKMRSAIPLDQKL